MAPSLNSSGPNSTPAPRRMVLLRHELPDGSWHFDWMFERPHPAPSEGPLRTFRVLDRPDRVARFDAESLPDHRRIYLAYQGPVSNNRGHVVRIADGQIDHLHESADRIDIVGSLAGERRQWTARAGTDQRWRFEARPA